jgi:bifunctional non-homologous end joining protein LigD
VAHLPGALPARAAGLHPSVPAAPRRPPARPDWLHEIKHVGYRLLGRKQGERVALWTRYGTDFTDRLHRIAEAVRCLPSENALIDGEAVVFLPDRRCDFAALRTKAGEPM